MQREREVPINTMLCGHNLDVMRDMPDGCIDCCVTSPPYWGLRWYGIPPVEWPEVSFSPMPGLPPMTIPAESSVHGLEKNIWAYVAHEVLIFREVKRVLSDHAVLFLNLGDSYCSTAPGTKNAPMPKGSKENAEQWANYRPETPSGLKPKDLCSIPWRTALALQGDGWYLRQDIIWHKPNPMPSSVTDRCTTSHEYVFVLTKQARYYWDQEAIKEDSITGDPRSPYGSDGMWEMDGRNKWEEGKGQPRVVRSPAGWKTGLGSHGTIHSDGREQEVQYVEIDASKRIKRSVWTVATQGTADAHFATFPPKLVEPMILAGCPREVCAVCGKPRERILEKNRVATRPGEDSKVYECKPIGIPGENKNRGRRVQSPLKPPTVVGNRDPERHITETQTVGWSDCGCGQGFRPGRVFDPFGGSGTTGAVAAKLKRDWLLIEQNPSYVTDIAGFKLQEAECGVPVREARAGQLPLFAAGKEPR